ncbi:MAG: VWA domain-containing protein [Deltaproteobacteria bacterium]|nr:VWA domain-containing protein [Deltaproteobacteria bacterium]
MHVFSSWSKSVFVLALLGSSFSISCGGDELSQVISDVSEVHYQGGGAVDMLFVVDNSGSMQEEQLALGASFDRFIEGFLELDTDFHIGVTDMDYVGTAGALLGDPLFLTQGTEDLIFAFRRNVNVGTNGSGTEKGLEAARQALGVAKTEGANRGFLREGASLAIVFLSDENDQSTADIDTYYDFFLGLKHGDTRRLLLSAIVGPSPNGCGTAETGSRYHELVQKADGISTSICDDDLGMPAIGDVVSGYKKSFDLQGQPIEGTLRVVVNSEELLPESEAWSLSDDGVVSFADGSTPEDCAEVQFAYSTHDVVIGPMPLVFDTNAPICALEGSDIDLDLEPKKGCSQGGVPTSFTFLFCAMWLTRRRRFC